MTDLRCARCLRACAFALAALLALLARRCRPRTLLPVPALTARVIDQTGTLSDAQRSALEAKLAAFEREVGSQLVIVMVRDARSRKTSPTTPAARRRMEDRPPRRRRRHVDRRREERPQGAHRAGQDARRRDARHRGEADHRQRDHAGVSRRRLRRRPERGGRPADRARHGRERCRRRRHGATQAQATAGLAARRAGDLLLRRRCRSSARC